MGCGEHDIPLVSVKLDGDVMRFLGIPSKRKEKGKEE
jgi:hypothetical protein